MILPWAAVSDALVGSGCLARRHYRIEHGCVRPSRARRKTSGYRVST
jgi:hypothetical protein